MLKLRPIKVIVQLCLNDDFKTLLLKYPIGNASCALYLLIEPYTNSKFRFFEYTFKELLKFEWIKTMQSCQEKKSAVCNPIFFLVIPLEVGNFCHRILKA